MLIWRAGNKCGACGSTVNLVEEVQGAGRSFHSCCFLCMDCRTILDGTVAVVKKDGLKGYCCSQGTGALNMDSEERLGIKPKCVQTHMAITHPNASKLAQKYSGTEKCPTCRDFEYASEGIIGDLSFLSIFIKYHLLHCLLFRWNK
uniref:Cysteine and glycine-rich protein 2 n=1 Tax=Neovison vison TaxID=452646 RepID=A0A8C7EIK2_NEOVI